MADQMSSEELAAASAVAQNVAAAAQQPGSREEKTERVETAISDGVKHAHPGMSDADAEALAKRLAPMIVAASAKPMADALIEQMRQLDVVFTPSEGTTAEPGSAQDATAAAAAEVVPPPRKLTFAERFTGRS